ncbi:MAG: hypothetical protein J4F28_08545 [Nitrosopumilaceae archaeon]|nr:hypothetical protein [Nitrosopumilaceae archaeon]
MAIHRVRTGGIAAELDIYDGRAKCVCGADDLRFDLRFDRGLRWVEQVSYDTIQFNLLTDDKGADGGGLLVQTSIKSKNCLSVMDDIMGSLPADSGTGGEGDGGNDNDDDGGGSGVKESPPDDE